MSEEIKTTAARLRELSAQLADPELADEKAQELASEAAELAARGGVLLDQGLRELADQGAPDPDG